MIFNVPTIIEVNDNKEWYPISNTFTTFTLKSCAQTKNAWQDMTNGAQVTTNANKDRYVPLYVIKPVRCE